MDGLDLARNFADAREWLVGGNGAVRAVILVNWTTSSTEERQMRGSLELWALNREGMPRLSQSEVCSLFN